MISLITIIRKAQLLLAPIPINKILARNYIDTIKFKYYW
ncbi:hypothetical protein VAFE106499_09710 [Vagococcus fessus]